MKHKKLFAMLVVVKLPWFNLCLKVKKNKKPFMFWYCLNFSLKNFNETVFYYSKDESRISVSVKHKIIFVVVIQLYKFFLNFKSTAFALQQLLFYCTNNQHFRRFLCKLTMLKSSFSNVNLMITFIRTFFYKLLLCFAKIYSKTKQ